MIKHSIIIPTAGRPESIKSAIQSVLTKNLSGFLAELIVVDNNTDESLSLELNKYCYNFLGQLRYVRELSPGLTAARHRGALEAKGELLTYLDDDVEVSDGWLAAIQNAFTDPDVAMVGGACIPKFTNSIPDWFWGYMIPTPYGGWMNPWISLIDIGKNIDEIDPTFIWGLNFSIRKKVLFDCGGFNPDLMPSQFHCWQGDGEIGLSMKVKALGLRADYRQDALLYHHCGADRLNIEYFKKRAFFQGISDSFTQLRAGNFLKASPKSSQHFRVLVRQIIRKFFPLRSNPWATASYEIKNKTLKAYQEGWDFHQKSVADNPVLIEWIRAPNFLSADVRNFN